MAWSWQYVGADGAPADPGGSLPGSQETFPTQADAETWLGIEWRSLAEAGVDAVSLLEDGRQVYGPMSLHAPG